MSSMGADTSQVQDVNLVGRLIDNRYFVRARIARGGLATVYVATDRRLGRDVAVKIMHPHLAAGQEGAEFIPRFRREARKAARLEHPGTVGIIDQGLEDNLPYLITEYVPGSSLRRDLLVFGTLPLGKCLAILDQVLAPVAAAHRKGLVHRDLKPENLLIDRHGTIKVADFGLARAVNEVTGAASGTIVGTAAYLAPEVFLSGESDPRTDVYAVGILGYEMLTGHLPFEGSNPLDVALHHVQDEMPAATDEISWLPVSVSDLLKRFAARDPAMRPRDAVAALAELRKVRRDLDIEQPEVLKRRQPPPEDFDEPETGELPAIIAITDDTDYLANDIDENNPTLPSLGNDTLDLDRIPTSAFTPASGIPIVADNAIKRVFSENTAIATVAVPEIVKITDNTTGNIPVVEQVAPPPAKFFARPRNRNVIALLAAVFILTAANLGTNWWFNSGPGAWTNVPTNMLGMSEGTAIRLLTNRSLLAEVNPEYSDEIPPGLVLAVSPPMGTQIRRHETISLLVSTGVRMVTVPTNLIGQTQNSAEQTLRAAEVRFTPVLEYSDETPAGTVIGLSHEEGSQIPHFTLMELKVSRGAAPVAIPQQIGRPRAEAEADLLALGLYVEFAEDKPSDTIPRGDVVAQNPSDGSLVHRGDTVTLTISSGPESSD